MKRRKRPQKQIEFQFFLGLITVQIKNLAFMNLPAEISPDLKKYDHVRSEVELIEILKTNPSDLTSFFFYACEDETWAEAHPFVMKELLNWMTLSYHKFPYAFLHPVIQTIQKHIALLKPLIPLDLILKNDENEYPINSFLLSHQSHYFLRRIVNERQGSKSLSLKITLPLDVIQIVDEFISTGGVKDLWKIQPAELWSIIDFLIPLGFNPLIEECEKVIRRYIDRNQVYDILLKAHRKSLLILQNACIEFINTLDMGVRLHITPIEYLSLELLNYKEKALEVFEKLVKDITHLVFTHETTQDAKFSTIINQCPKLIGLDLSESQASDYLNEIPSSIKELYLMRCQWINRQSLQILALACPGLTRLNISGNSQLTYVIWSELTRFKKLSSLDISYCSQISDNELKIILQACPSLIEFNLMDCQKISPEGFFEMARLLPNLALLNVARTTINDPALIDLMAHCRNLYSLDLSRCHSITEKGVVEGVKNCPSLKMIKLFNTRLTQLNFEEIRKINPYLNVFN